MLVVNSARQKGFRRVPIPRQALGPVQKHAYLNSNSNSGLAFGRGHLSCGSSQLTGNLEH